MSKGECLECVFVCVVFVCVRKVHEEIVTELPSQKIVIIFLTPRVKIPNLAVLELEGF